MKFPTRPTRSTATRFAALAALVTACSIAPTAGGAASATPSGTEPASPGLTTAIPRPSHVVVVVMENHSYGQIIGSSSAPFVNRLARSGALFTQSYAVAHPSEPNYLALFSGSTQGVSDDSCPHTFSGVNLGARVIASGRRFVGFSESLPATGYRGCVAGSYARKHSPWVNFTSIPGSANQPMSRWPTSPSSLPALAFVTPNLDNDMHDGSVATGDSWLARHIGPYASWARTHNSILVLTWDEDADNAGNHVATMVVGAGVRTGPYSGYVNHYRLLRMLSDLLRVRPMGHAATAAPITAIWR